MWNLAIFRHFAVGRRELQSNVPFECALTGPNPQWFWPLLKSDDNPEQTNLNAVGFFKD